MSVKRYDSTDIAKWMTTPFVLTQDGKLHGRAIVTSCGVFSYRKADGTIRAELRLPEEVFRADSLSSMNGKPITNNHPNGLIKDNANYAPVGFIGYSPSSCVDMQAVTRKDKTVRGITASDGIHVANDLTISDRNAIAEIQAGKRALSMGYACDIEDASGVWAGVPYNAIQRNIVYDHVAIVNKGRAGDSATIHLDSIRLDSEDAVFVDQNYIEKGDGKMPMKKMNLDGVEYEAEERIIAEYVAQKKRADSAEAELEKEKASKTDSAKALSAMEADRDTQKERADKAETKLKELEIKKLDSAEIDKLCTARLELLQAAVSAGVEIKKDMADIDIKKAVVLAVYPKADFAGKDEVYVQARFDAAVETIADGADAGVRVALAGTGDRPAPRLDAVTAREKMIETLRKTSRGLKEGQ